MSKSPYERLSKMEAELAIAFGEHKASGDYPADLIQQQKTLLEMVVVARDKWDAVTPTSDMSHYEEATTFMTKLDAEYHSFTLKVREISFPLYLHDLFVEKYKVISEYMEKRHPEWNVVRIHRGVETFFFQDVRATYGEEDAKLWKNLMQRIYGDRVTCDVEY